MPGTAEELQSLIANVNGADAIYRHKLCRGHCYTSGVRSLAISAGAWWLVDAMIIASHAKKLQQLSGGFEAWKLEVTGTSAMLSCTDGNSPEPLYTQQIRFTDFPLAEISFYLEGGLLMLPGER